jgi:hypothetical protein
LAGEIEMKELKPTLKPIDINSNLWYYEDKRSIDIYHHSASIGRIQARTLLKSLSRIYGIDFIEYEKKHRAKVSA